MASGPITSWKIGEETMEIVKEFIFLAPKSLQMVTATMELEQTNKNKQTKKSLLLGRKAMSNLAA